MLVTLCASCASAGTADEPGDPFAMAQTDGQVTGPSLEQLEASGPAYTPFDTAPALESGTWLSELLGRELVPVIEGRGLPADQGALVWGLIAEDGTVRSAVIQTTSGDAQFDEAALVVAGQLSYEPARNEGSVVPVWILIEVSMLLR